MSCSGCQAQNDEGAEACAFCGQQLCRTCPSCRARCGVDGRFCAHCAAPLDAGGAAVAAPADGPGELRRLTLLFCDLVGATAISATLGPEDWTELVQSYHQACGQVVKSFDGHVAQYLGDGLLAYFGYPVAFEDSARRAVQAGLAVVQAVATVDRRWRARWGIPLHVRVGIHTGATVVDAVGDRRDRLALGDAPHLAARAQSIATPGTVVISDSTHELTQGFFACDELGPQMLKGFARPVTLYHVTGETGATSRLEAATSRGLTHLVGREVDQARLGRAWDEAKGGRGSALVLLGEAGIGKSRHVAELRRRIGDDAHTLLECRCSLYHQASPLHPIVDLLERQLGITRELPAEAIVAKLRDLTSGLGRSGDAPVRLLGSLLSVPLGPACPPPDADLAPALRRQETFDLLLAWLAAVTSAQPALLVVEDLHWADPSSLELLGRFLGRAEPGAVLSILTARPELRLGWPTSSASPASITVERLTAAEGQEMVAHLTHSKPLPAEVVGHILARADGIPLFVEEITRTVLESGLVRETADAHQLVGLLNEAAIPATLQDSLASRLDRLGPSKLLLQLAAVIGREFTFDLIAVASPLSADAVRTNLEALVDAQLLVRQGTSAAEVFSFKHALIQEAAYGSLLKSKRRQYHLAVATAMKLRSPDIAERRPELLARHYAAAGRGLEAMSSWHAAGQRAIASSAYAEAIDHCNRGLAEMASLSESHERARLEMDLRACQGLALITTRGFAAVEVEETYSRAAELCDDLEDALPVRLLYGIWVGNFVRGDLGSSRRLVPHFLKLAAEASDRSERLVAHAALETWSFWRGEYGTVMLHHDRAAALIDVRNAKQQHEALLRDYGFEGLLYPALYFSWFQLIAGRWQSARRIWNETVRLAETIADPYVMVGALGFGAAMHHDAGDLAASMELANRVEVLSSQNGSFMFWMAVAMVIHGRALVARADADAGIARINEGLALFRAIGAKTPYPYYQSYLAEALLEVGRLDEALAVLDEALAMTKRNVDRAFRPELARLKAVALARKGDAAAAGWFHRLAGALSRKQHARMFELKAAADVASGEWPRAVRRPVPELEV
jgi:class 3 adenylate cyclase/tetratricopeptide (TPR) repeat protein